MILHIIGLGNPGSKYYNTPHNIGMRVVEKILKSECAGAKVWIPDTYMNDSGKAVLKRVYRTDSLCVLHDDLELTLNTVKFKFGGSAAGHNGLRSINSWWGSDYLRIRIGVGRPESGVSVSDFVLSAMTFDSCEIENHLTKFVVQNIESLIKLDPQQLTELYKSYKRNE